MDNFIWVIVEIVLITIITFSIFFTVNVNAMKNKIAIALLISVSIGIWLYPGYTEFEYDHLLSGKIYEANKIDDKSELKTHCFDNITHIKWFLEQKDIIERMNQTMNFYDIVCISPHYLKMGESSPNMVMMSRIYYEPKRFTVKSSRAEQLLYLFNPIEVGGSARKNGDIDKLDLMYKNPKWEQQFVGLVIQVNALIPVFYKELHIDRVNLVFTGVEAFCLQYYLNEISNKTQCF